jgi:mediator of RNA polymerase II transcription subunit 12
VTKPTCLLLPKTWEKHGSTLGTFAQRRALAQITHTVAGLDARNVQFSQSVGVPSSTSKDAAERIYHLLDSVDYNASIRIDELAYDCMEIRSDAGSLVSAAMQWASSIYREGSHHIYLATRLLRRWNHLGADIYSSILQYLSTLVSDASKEPAAVFRIIAELLRSKTFSLGRYLQWLIATGSLTQHTDLYSVSSPLGIP